MSRDNSNNLPSYKDFFEKPDDDLPSIEEVLEENLPSVDDFLQKPVDEETQTIENSDGEAFLEVSDVIAAPEWSELVRLVNDVRKDIPQIPEIKSYDEELEQLGDQITQIQTNFSLLDAKSDKIEDLSAQNEEFGVKLTEIESKIPEVPEVRYYEEDIRFIHDKITRIKGEIDNLPEVKYYEEDLETLKSRIEEVNKAIPTFPDWVQKVQEVPDFSWIGKTFSIIDDDFNKVQGHLDIIRDKIDYQVNELTESIEKKDFEVNVDIKRLDKELTDTSTVFNEVKNNLYKEMRDCSTRLWEHQKTFKDDDRKLKKSILSEQNKLKQALQKEIKDINEQSIKADESILKFFNELKDNLPEVKYYDEDISDLRKDVKSTKGDVKVLIGELYKIASVIKKQQKTISEGLLNEPPDVKQTAGFQTDPLTPEDQKFATLEDLSNHYRLFINRIQTQLSTIGGGGAGFIKDLDDVNFDSTAGDGQLLIWDSPNNRWVGIASTSLVVTSSVGAAGTWGTDSVGIHTVKSVGIGTTARSGFSLYVEGDQFVDGNITVGGTITYDDVKNVDSLGIITGRDNINIVTDGKKLQIGADADLQIYHDSGQSYIDNNTGPLYIRNNVDDDDGGNIIIEAKSGKASAVFQDDEGVRLYYDNAEKFETTSGGINITGNIESDSLNVTGISTISTGLGTVHIGAGNTALLVEGDTRITGILTIGTSSVEIDGVNNTISVGLVTVTNSTIILGDNVSLDASATGINSAPNVFYVAKDGNDSNNGTSIDNAKLTIAGAVGVAQSGSVIKVLSGNYVESNPIELPAFVAVVGDDQRTVKVLPSNTTQDIFHVNKGCKLANMTFSGHLSPAAAVAFPTGIATNVGGGKWKGPYIQNCTSDTTTGTGIFIDGDKAEKTKSMNVDAFTQYNQGGVGVAVTNEGYAQLVSVFTICCDKAITVHKGGQADVANSNCSFGTFGLIADGVGPEQFTGSVGIATSSGGGSSTDYSEVTLSGLSPSSFNQTYTRQSTGFVLNTATAGSGSAQIHADSSYYYYVASTGSANTNRALIFSEEDNKWVTIFTFSINFTEGNISDGQSIGSVFTDDVTAGKTTADGRNVPTASSDIVYATSGGGGGGGAVGTGTAVAGQDNVIVNVGAVTTRPYDGQVVYFDQLYKSVESITITNGGSGYTSTPSVTISSPSGPNGEVGTAFATLEDGVVTSIDIISSGSQYTGTATVTISAPDTGVTATATANMADTYYTINSSTPISAGITTLTLAENLLNTVGVGSTAYFFQQSKIIASSHTFEYIGSGNDITLATPKRGGVTIQANEVLSQNGGSVIYTSTDQSGNFRIGDDLQINQSTGTISGRAFSKSLFSEMTPFILALS